MSKWRILFAVFLLMIVIAFPVMESRALGAGRLYEHPIAFVGADGLYVTDSTGKSPARAIAKEVISNTTYTFISRPRWSPDGSQIAVSEYNVTREGVPSLHLKRVESGGDVTLLPWSQELRIESFTWLANGTQIAIYDSEVIHVLSLDTGQVKRLYTPQAAGMIGEMGGGEDPSIGLTYQEREEQRYRTTYGLINTPFGLLVHSLWDEGATWGLVSLNGSLQWKDFFVTALVVSPDGKRAVARYGGYLEGQDAPPMPDSEPVVLVDFESGKVTLLPFEPGVLPMAWSADGKSIYYSTMTKVDAIEGNPESALGLAMFEYNWPFNAEEYDLNLWKIPVDAKDKSEAIRLFRTRGYNFGVMTVSDDPTLPLIISLVPSSVPYVKAINEGTSRSDAEKLAPVVKILALDPKGSGVLWSMSGSRPAYGKKDFLVVLTQ
jgi:hypothetical protein